MRAATFGRKPVVMVAGNHEFYGRELSGELQRMREMARGSNVHLLDRDEFVLGGVRFLGCTLWTDFQLPVQQPSGALVGDQVRSLVAANQQLNDFVHVRLADGPPGKQRLLRAQDTLEMHQADREWLHRAFTDSFEGPTVVVTHHAPTAGSVLPEYQGDELAPAFVSELPEEFFEVPLLWVHGHTHSSADYFRGPCRILSNPRGYPRQDGSCENRSFERARIVEVLARRSEVWRRRT
ncbi:metallophosphoesterase [Rubrivivax gelatinosus]|uniref:metallophosphoesterase n=1 Tax=Rubrivivax gelatinosus TaxID=28068 RepID=UPI00068087EA|nr:metallophosphoesterase [Rubrivivax gelatinosus]MBG6082432.1 hypothetical protein [Rubrivivax gelatinosus]